MRRRGEDRTFLKSVSNVRISDVGSDWMKHKGLHHTGGNKHHQECEDYFVGNHLGFRKTVITKKRY